MSSEKIRKILLFLVLLIFRFLQDLFLFMYISFLSLFCLLLFRFGISSSSLFSFCLFCSFWVFFVLFGSFFFVYSFICVVSITLYSKSSSSVTLSNVKCPNAPLRKRPRNCLKILLEIVTRRDRVRTHVASPVLKSNRERGKDKGEELKR